MPQFKSKVYRSLYLQGWLSGGNKRAYPTCALQKVRAYWAESCPHAQALQHHWPHVPSNTPLSSGQSCCLQPGPLVKIVLHSEEESWDDFPTVAAAWSTCQAARLKALKRAEVHYSAARTPFVLKGTFTALVQRSCKSPVSSHLGVTGQHFGGSPSLPVWSLPAGLEGKASGHGPPQESNCFQMGQLVETKRSPITKLLINLHVEVPIRKCGMAKPQLASKPISARKHSSE